MKRALAIAALVWSLLLAVLLHTSIKDWLWTHPWWHSFLVALPGIVAVGIGLWHSNEANKLHRENIELRRKNIELRRQYNKQSEMLDSERNQHLQHLQDIAKHIKPPPTDAECKAFKLRGYIGRYATVSDDKGVWGFNIRIAEVSDDCIATLFSPFGSSSTHAWAVNVHCNDLELTDIGGQLKLRVNKRYGDTINLGILTRWEERNQPVAAALPPEKGRCAFDATYSKAGSAERRGLAIYSAKDGSNRFILEVLPSGEVFTGDNIDISKRFVMLQVEIEAEGFTRSQSGTASSEYPLYVKTR